MSIFKNGIKVSGQVEVGGSTGTPSDVITGGDTPGFTTPADYFKGTFPHIPPLGQRSRAPKKLLMLGLGNSNWLGEASDASQPDRDGIHRTEAGLYEVSQGREHDMFSVAPEGELMQLRVPNQDNFRFEKNETGDGPNWPVPSIDPVSTYGKAGPKLAAMKRAKALLPEIEEIAILTCGIGGSGLAAINEDSYRNVADWLPRPTWEPAPAMDRPSWILSAKLTPSLRRTLTTSAAGLRVSLAPSPVSRAWTMTSSEPGFWRCLPTSAQT